MLEINEAFETLSDPVLRKEYDNARAHPNNRTYQDAASARSTQARAKAQNYPREWTAFQQWMDEITKDVHAAKYSHTGTSTAAWGFFLPTAGESLTGWIMIIVGGIFGFFFWQSVIRQPDHPVTPNPWMILHDKNGKPILPQPQNDWSQELGHVHTESFLGGGLEGDTRLKFMLPWICLSGGAWIGALLHRQLGKQLSKQVSQQPPPIPAHKFVQCPQCAQMLRLPLIAKPMNVTCPTCKHVFFHDS
jgi:hypothetical protein